MSNHNSEQQAIARTHNTARFFTETRHVAWVLLVGTLVWGVYGYLRMPQRKDPDIPVRQALALCPWPGASAEKIEQLVTRRIEEKVAENVKLEKVESNTRTGITAVYITLVDNVKDPGKELDDIKLKLDSLTNLPDGAGPIEFVKDFGDTAALMLTVASPVVPGSDVAARAAAVRKEIETVRATATPGRGPRVTLVQNLPATVPADLVRRPLRMLADAGAADLVFTDARLVIGDGFIAVDAVSTADDAALAEYAHRFTRERLRASEFHPDAWPVVVVRDPADTLARLESVAGDKYSYRELDDFTDLIARTLKTLPIVSKVTRSGLRQEQIYLEVLAGAARRLRRQGWLAGPRARRPQHRDAGRRDRVGRQEPDRGPVGRVQERARDRRCHGEDLERRVAVSCAISRASPAATRARRATSTSTLSAARTGSGGGRAR